MDCKIQKLYFLCKKGWILLNKLRPDLWIGKLRKSSPLLKNVRYANAS